MGVCVGVWGGMWICGRVLCDGLGWNCEDVWCLGVYVDGWCVGVQLQERGYLCVKISIYGRCVAVIMWMRGVWMDDYGNMDV